MHKQSPKKTGYLLLDLDIQPDCFKIMHNRTAILPLQIKKAGVMTGFLTLVIDATYENISLVIPLYQPIDSS